MDGYPAYSDQADTLIYCLSGKSYSSSEWGNVQTDKIENRRAIIEFIGGRVASVKTDGHATTTTTRTYTYWQ